MKTISSKNNIQNRIDIVHSKLDQIDCNKIALETGFIERRPRKISPKDFLLGFILNVFGTKNNRSIGNNSLESWASKIALLTGETVSKQAIFKKLRRDPTEFLRKFLERLISKTLEWNNALMSPLIAGFENIFLHDSTCIMLNGKLFKYYPGNGNNSPDLDKSVLKIQSVYNIAKMSFSQFELTSFRENDQSKSKDIISVAKKGDLVLRDLGYFSLEVFKTMIDMTIFFISRIPYHIGIYEPGTNKKLKLIKLLRKRDFLDLDVVLGKTSQVPLRLVAIKLDKKTAQQRRRRARMNRDKRVNHTKEYYELLSWHILITNIDRQRLNFQEIAELYHFRFRIEVIFKCWKSYFKISDVLNYDNRLRMEVYIYSVLIFIVLFQTDYLRFIEYQSLKGKNISMMKFTKFIAENFLIVILLEALGKTQCFIEQIIYYCSYQPRRDRTNYSEKILKLG